MKAEMTDIPHGRPDGCEARVCVALTEDGVALPVVDITNPAFACDFSDEQLAAIAERTRRGLARSKRLPTFVLRLLGRRSVIMRGMLANPSFVSGMITYLFKLGPEILPPAFGDRLDRRMLSTIGPVACRLRLREAARQIADALSPLLTRRNGPLRLINIAGGVAADAFNALLLLQREQPALLVNREIRLAVLDIDSDGPAFGSRAVAALTAEQAPLAGLNVTLEHSFYDWNNASALAGILGGLPADAVAAGSSEGGLFEYADDEIIVSNLVALRAATPPDFVMVGSLVRDDNLAWFTRGAGSLELRPRGLAAFGALVEGAGWAIRQTMTDPLYHVVTLKKANS